MNTDEKQPASVTAKAQPMIRSSTALNIGLIVIALAWLAILANNGDARIERWLAACVLALVGLTGVFRIGTKRSGKAGADSNVPDAKS